MWKESYRIGIEAIDRQHMELFARTEELIQAINRGADRESYQRILTFLQEYVVLHFRAEEEYQKSIGYKGLAEHQKAHREFTELVEDYVHRLVDSDFSIELVKDLAGTLTAWLIYHVCNTDVQIARSAQQEDKVRPLSTLHAFLSGIQDTLPVIAGLDAYSFRTYDTVERIPAADEVHVSIDLTGDINGRLLYSYTEEFALRIVEKMTMLQPEGVDELVCSALAEITNISAGNGAVKLSLSGITCNISTPSITREERLTGAAGGLVLESGIGTVRLSARLDRY